MNIYASLAVFAGVATFIAVRTAFLHRKHLRIYGDAWRQYNAGAFVTKVVPSPDKDYEMVTRLANELATPKGQLAVSLRASGWAIHHINKNGTFAKRGPYYVSQYRGKWRPTGRTLLITTVRGKGGHGFKPDHYNQNGVISEKGWAVLEYGTQKYPPLSLGDFVALQKRSPTPKRV